METAFDNSKPTIGINMWGQPIAHGENSDLLVLDTEGLYKPSNNNTSSKVSNEGINQNQNNNIILNKNINIGGLNTKEIQNKNIKPKIPTTPTFLLHFLFEIYKS